MLSNIWRCEFKPRSVVIVTGTCPKPSYVHVFHTLTQIKPGFSSSPWNHCDCSSSDMLLVYLLFLLPHWDTSLTFVWSDCKISQDLPIIIFSHLCSIVGSQGVSMHFSCGFVVGCNQFVCRRDSQKSLKCWQSRKLSYSRCCCSCNKLFTNSYYIGRSGMSQLLWSSLFRAKKVWLYAKISQKSFNCLPFIRTVVMSIFTQQIFLPDLIAKSERIPENREWNLFASKCPLNDVNWLSKHVQPLGKGCCSDWENFHFMSAEALMLSLQVYFTVMSVETVQLNWEQD